MTRRSNQGFAGVTWRIVPVRRPDAPGGSSTPNSTGGRIGTGAPRDREPRDPTRWSVAWPRSGGVPEGANPPSATPASGILAGAPIAYRVITGRRYHVRRGARDGRVHMKRHTDAPIAAGPTAGGLDGRRAQGRRAMTRGPGA